jgi:excisionase family DNA binding protein
MALESTPAPAGRFLTRAEIADRLRVHPRSIDRAIANGDLTAVRIGRAVRVCEDDFASFVERHRSSAAGEGT